MYLKFKINNSVILNSNFNWTNFGGAYSAIEGNSFTVNDTRELKEHGLNLKLRDRSMLEAFEILDHFKAFEYLFNNLVLPLNEKLLIDTHKLLTANTIQYTRLCTGRIYPVAHGSR